MNFLTILLAAAGLVVTRAQMHSLPETESSALRAFCIAIRDRAMDLDEESPFSYRYEAALWQMAGASPSDELSVARAKIQQFWINHRADLTCETKDARESVLRFAVRNDFLELIEDLTEKYEVDVRLPDASDGKTLMEFIAAELAYTKGSAASPAYHRLEVFYDYMKSSGTQARSRN